MNALAMPPWTPAEKGSTRTDMTPDRDPGDQRRVYRCRLHRVAAQGIESRVVMEVQRDPTVERVEPQYHAFLLQQRIARVSVGEHADDLHIHWRT